VTTAAANLLTDATETAAPRWGRVAKALGITAVTEAFKTSYNATRGFLHRHKPTLLALTGTTVMAAGLAGAAYGASTALATEATNMGNQAYLAMAGTNADYSQLRTAAHSRHEGALGAGGAIMLFVGAGTVAQGVRRRREATDAAEPASHWSTIRVDTSGPQTTYDYSPNLGALDSMLSAPYHPPLIERIDARLATAVEAREAQASLEAEHYDGFATYMVPGAPDLNQIAGLSLD
jgi:hypothetical protein